MSDDSLRVVGKVETEREDDGRCLAEVLELPGVLAYGESEDAALSKVQALALRVIAERLEHSEAGPELLTISFSAASPRGRAPGAKGASTISSHAGCGRRCWRSSTVTPGCDAPSELVWPRATVQRCCVHKLRNLERKAPKYTLAEIRDDFHRIVYATNADAARTAYTNLRAHVGQTLPGRGDESVGRRRRTAYVLRLSESALENLADHEHD